MSLLNPLKRQRYKEPMLAPRIAAMNASLLLLLAGCQPNATPNTTIETAKADTPTPPVEVQQSTTGGAGGQTQEQSKEKHRHNDNRAYQLDDLQRVKIKVNGKHEFDAWVMDTEFKRQEGMMFLEDQDFKKTDAMVFVFKDAQPLRFWMRNTLVPLDIMYVNERKAIIKTYTMKARDEVTDYSSNGNAKYAIEFKAGIFKELGIKSGQKVEIPDSVKSEEN